MFDVRELSDDDLHIAMAILHDTAVAEEMKNSPLAAVLYDSALRKAVWDECERRFG